MQPRRRNSGIGLALVSASIILSGCLPFGNRHEPTELFPADSVSRSLAATVGIDSLVLVRRIEPDTAAFFGSMQLGPDSLIWIGDLSTSRIRRFDADGSEREPIRSELITYPYMAGSDSTTTFVYDVGADALLGIRGNSVKLVTSLPARTGGVSLSRFVSTLDGRAYVVDTGRKDGATLTIAEPDSTPVRVRLPGRPWRYHGILRAWGTRMVGTSSFRPTLYFFDEAAGIDSMSLRGFDSPMLARSRAFELGEVDEPPLMVSAFSTIGERLYVLNVRPGIVRIDEYDASGTLRRAFENVAPEPESFTPVDLLALESADGDVTFFVVSTSTEYGSISLNYRSRLDRFVASE